jgi:hypothetical protein
MERGQAGLLGLAAAAAAPRLHWPPCPAAARGPTPQPALCSPPNPPAPARRHPPQEHPEIVVDEAHEPVEDATEPVPGEPIKVWANLVAFVERLDDELFKSLQVGGRGEGRGWRAGLGPLLLLLLRPGRAQGSGLRGPLLPALLQAAGQCTQRLCSRLAGPASRRCRG